MRYHLISLSLLIFIGVSAQAADVRSGKNGTYHLPKGLKKGEKIPVFIVEKGIGEAYTKFASTLQKKTKAIVVEMVNIRRRGPANAKLVKSKLKAALKECETFHSLEGCPLFPIGFSMNAAATIQAVLSEPKSFNGLILINAGARPNAIPANLSKAKGFPVLILHGTKDPTFPVAMADAMNAALKAKGLNVSLKKVKTKNHMAPFTLGLDSLLQFANTFGKVETAARKGGAKGGAK